MASDHVEEHATSIVIGGHRSQQNNVSLKTILLALRISQY